MMRNNRKIIIASVLTLVVALVAGAASYALAQSGSGDQELGTAGDVESRHVDYDLSLQVEGDLSAVDPRLEGILPLNLTASGGADIQKGDQGPQARGNVGLGGLDTIIQKIADHVSGSDQGAALSSLINGAVSDLQFVETEGNLYVNLAGSWYELGQMNGCHRHGEDGDDPAGGHGGKLHEEMGNILPDGPQSLLKNVQQVGQEDIDGVSTTHTTASVDVDKAITVAVGVLNSAGKTDKAGELEAARPQIEAAARQLDVQWWIDGDGQLRQVKVSVEVNPSALAPLAEGREVKAQAAIEGITSVKLDATAKFSRFGEDFQIAKPEGDIKPIQDLADLAGVGIGHGHGGADPHSDWHHDQEAQGQEG